MNGAKVLVLGVAYKQDIDDYRESPALRVIESLRKLGAQVSYYDPYVESYRYQGQEEHRIPALDKAALGKRGPGDGDHRAYLRGL